MSEIRGGMNKASWLWAPGHLPINHPLTPPQPSYHPPCVKSLWPNQSFTVLPFFPSLSAFPPFCLAFLRTCLCSSAFLPLFLTISFTSHHLSPSLSLLHSALYTLFHHSLSVCLQHPFSCLNLMVIFLLLSPAVMHFHSLASLLSLVFLVSSSNGLVLLLLPVKCVKEQRRQPGW